MKRILNREPGDEPRNKRIKGSFFTMVTKYVFLLLICILLIGKIMSEALVRLTSNLYGAVNTEMLNDCLDELEDKRYPDVQKRIFYDSKSYIEILNEEMEIVYHGGKAPASSFSKEEVSYIPGVFDDTSITVKRTEGVHGEKNTVIVSSGYLGEEEDEITEVTILDEKGNIVYSTMELKENRLTETQIRLWAGRYNSDYNIRKYPFTANDGANYVMLTYIYSGERNSFEIFERFYYLTVGIQALLSIALLGIFIILMNQRIKKPLDMVNRSLIRYSQGERGRRINYSGLREFVRLGDSFNEMAERLSESEERQKKMAEERMGLLADISHDLRTPVTVIQGYSKAIMDGMIPEEKQKRYLSAIYQKSNVLSGLINSFYEYSRLEHPHFDLQKEKEDICEFLRTYLIDKYDELDSFGIELQTQIPDKPLVLEYDEFQLRRVLDNLVSNSIKYAGNGSKIFVSAAVAGDNAVIKIGDNGTGIPGKIKNTIFEPFVVGDESRNSRQGTGLGLAISHKIIELHGGKILLDSDEDNGLVTVFCILLPVG